jgi:RsiW-degrading membrane proteinase PrsW (M82 family)
MIIFWAGATFWIGDMIVHTGWAGIAELRASLYFVIELVIITSATRTIDLDRVASMYCLGGGMMAVMFLVSAVFTSLVPSPDAVSRQFVVPLMEEALKLAPVAFFLWRRRGTRLWSVGASDVLLLAVASGAGFGLVEEAYYHHDLGPTLALDWFPLTRINGATLTVGHATWTGLAGATLGLALLWRPRKPLNYLLAGSGLLWSIIDHCHHNYGVDRRGISVDLFNGITGHGWLSLYFFVLAVIVVIAADLNVIHRVLPPVPELHTPLTRLLSFNKDAVSAWQFLLTRRALAFAGVHYRQEPPSVRSGQLEPVLQGLAGTLVGLRATEAAAVP